MQPRHTVRMPSTTRQGWRNPSRAFYMRRSSALKEASSPRQKPRKARGIMSNAQNINCIGQACLLIKSSGRRLQQKESRAQECSPSAASRTKHAEDYKTDTHGRKPYYCMVYPDPSSCCSKGQARVQLHTQLDTHPRTINRQHPQPDRETTFDIIVYRTNRL